MKTFMSRFLISQSSVAVLRYGLVVAGIAVAIIAAVQTVGTALNVT
jgi:Flp pilus assembly pilin Flp